MAVSIVHLSVGVLHMEYIGKFLNLNLSETESPFNSSCMVCLCRYFGEVGGWCCTTIILIFSSIIFIALSMTICPPNNFGSTGLLQVSVLEELGSRKSRDLVNVPTQERELVWALPQYTSENSQGTEATRITKITQKEGIGVFLFLSHYLNITQEKKMCRNDLQCS